jgi:acyl-CoA reductase-like NAD-dependent aldehyde dehydrogenase
MLSPTASSSTQVSFVLDFHIKGGFKQSGWGREKGPYGLDLFTEVKSVVVNYT